MPIPEGFKIVGQDDVAPNVPTGFKLVQPLEGGSAVSPINNQADEPTVGDRVLRQVGLTGRALAEGAAGTVGLLSDPFAFAIRDAINQATDNNIEPQSLRGIVGGLLTAAGVPSPETRTEEIVQSIGQAMAGGGGTAGAAKGVSSLVAGPVAKGVSTTLAAQPAAQIVGAGTGQASTELAREQGASELGQLAAGLAGGLVGGGVASLRPTAPKPQVVDDIAAAQAQGIQPLTSDVVPPQSFAAKWLRSAGEKIPVAGTGPVRAKQQAQRVAAIKNVLVENNADDAIALSDDVMGDLLKTRAAKITANTAAKSRVIDNLEAAGDVDVRSTVTAIDDEVARLTSLSPTEMAPAIDKLNTFKADIQGQPITNIEKLRSQLGESFTATELATIKNTSKASINNIYRALRDDMGTFISEMGGPKEHTKWMEANKRLSKMIGELDKSALKTALNKGTATPEMIRGLLLSKKPSDIRALHKNLSPKGRSTARAAILADIAEKAKTGDAISVQKFATGLEKAKDRINVFFPGDKGKQLQGLQKALNLTERASAASVNTPTGQELAIPVGAAVLTDLVGGAGAALITGGSLGGFARLYESKPMRDALVRLSNSKLRPAEEAALLKRVISIAQAHKRNNNGKENDQ